MLPPMPPWDSLHPLVIHFPIALLIVAPVLVVLSLIFSRQASAFGWAALILMILGSVGAVVAVATGQAAAELADRAGGVGPVLEHHQALAETVRTVFIVLTVIYLGILTAARIFREPKRLVFRWAANGLFLCFYAAGVVMLANAAHEGGRLVHEFGVHSMMAPVGSDTASPNPATEDRDE